MCESDLKKILENHLHWLREDCEGWENMRADLSRAYLSGANLSGANLSRANLPEWCGEKITTMAQLDNAVAV